MLPEDAKTRKSFPVFEGWFNYFPSAHLLASHISWLGQQQHGPDQPLQWNREKSPDQLDACIRHLIEARNESDPKARAKLYAQAFWRLGAQTQVAIEAAGGLVAMFPGEGGDK